ncbi:MAG: TonB-dependent receptor plug domain-containing protein [Bacteroidales bacterium]|nr:TonB-dependent receptor plug domain-containing protein [Bacteroidales bacterium]
MFNRFFTSHAAALRLTAALSCLALAAPALKAQEKDLSDSLLVEQLQEVVISAVRASKDAPFAVSNIDRRSLQSFSSTGKELPMLFARTPGILAWSENGVGTGTSYMRIRGAGGSRINVTLDGVPLNSPEDQTVFWANMNSYASLLGSVQIQRGVGTSTNGDGAFGGTVALGTKAPALVPSLEVSGSYGSFNTWNAGGSFSSGLLGNHFVLEGAWHHTATDGYLHGTDGSSGSYLAALTWLGIDYTLSYKLLGNYEMTGQAWNGVTSGNDGYSLNSYDGIKTYQELHAAGLGQYNSLYEILPGADDYTVYHNEDGSYRVERYRMIDGSYWPRTTDNFWQNHHLLSFAWDSGRYWDFSAVAHYTRGYGYYEEFRYQNKLVKYGIPWFTDKAGNTVKKSDFVRQKGLDQDTYGLVSNISYNRQRFHAVAGLSVQQFTGNHFGYLLYASHAELSDQILKDGNYRYYDSDASKFDGSVFAKATVTLAPWLSAFGDVQYRRVRYKTGGYNDKYIDNEDGTASKHFLDVDETYDFFNPKAGLNFSFGAHRLYASAALSHREPERNNFTDNGKYPAPRAERLLDFEGGYQLSTSAFRAGANLYYMRYKDQLVQTGEVSDIGEALTTNIPDSYRTGVELTAAWDLAPWLTLEGNAALSRNRLLDFDEYVDDWDRKVSVFHYEDKALSFSPDAILNGFIDLHAGGFQAVWHTGFVSRMYLDNTENADRSLPAYSLSDLSLNYTFHFRKFLKELRLGVDAANIFSARVAQSGWVYSAISESSGLTDENRYYQLGFVPVAPLTVIGHIALRF